MMEEVSISVAYNAHIIDQMSEEEILASLVAESLPKQAVPTSQIPSKKLRQEDPLDRYQQENLCLHETSLRLEQENDHLAHELVTSKIALRNALNQAEDKVDELTQEFLKTRHHLEVAKEEKKEKEEEATQLKEVFRKELEKTGTEVNRANSIIADYKQICSQLNTRLEKQQTDNDEEMASIKSKVMECGKCCKLFSVDGTLKTEESRTLSKPSPSRERDLLQDQVRELEKELAQTKLQMVEAKCRIQELEHQNGALTTDLQEAKNGWLRKTLGSLRMATTGAQASTPRDDILAPLSSSRSGWVSARRLSLALREGRKAHV
ncbi:rab GTPase-activating protein 1-like isoform X1 [Alosa sapidissima]|uniref:rab GTPase-activating protein 1-like isoform X1 n=1 Tax=Alosa sapidissima TaxID=34773 RepID=UPI001C09FA80|nr:rab GTPase-activating protein 1-like isoform X1 [Alosa sapidissima]